MWEDNREFTCSLKEALLWIKDLYLKLKQLNDGFPYTRWSLMDWSGVN